MRKKLRKGFLWRGGVIHVRTDPLEGKQKSTGCTDPEAAYLWNAERERLAASPGYAASTRATVGDWILKTIDFKKTQERSGDTVEMYEIKLGHSARIFGKDSPLAVITSATIDGYIAQRKREGAKNNTIARELTCIRQMLRLARRGGVFGRGIDEVMPIGFSANYTPVTRTLTWEQVNDVLLPACSPEVAAWICLALSTAGDTSDVERAQKEDFDRARWTFRMRGTKNKRRSAVIPIPEVLRPLLERALPFLPVAWPRSSHALGELTERLGLGHFSPKDLRRSACTWLVEAGVPEDVVSRWMRHKNSTMVRMIYGQMRPEKLGELIDQHLQKRDSFDGPLGGIGRRRGFKRRRSDRAERRLARIIGLAERELASLGGSGQTETRQGNGALLAARLQLLELVDAHAAKPGLAVMRGLASALRGDLDEVERQLAAGAEALGVALG